MTISAYAKLDQPEILACLFHPRQEAPSEENSSILDHTYESADGTPISARFHLTEDTSTPTIVFFHGNAEIASDYDDVGPEFVWQGINFLAVDYRGYGLSGGTPTVSAIMEDAHLILDQTLNWLKSQGRTGELFVMGRSLGSAVALELMHTRQQDLAGLLIDSGFGTTMPLLLNLGIDPGRYDITEEDGFQNLQKIASIMKPVYILHGQFDEIIPVQNAELLQVQCPAKSKQFQIIPGADHNSLFEMAGPMYFEDVRRFFNKVLKIRPKKYQSRRKLQ